MPRHTRKKTHSIIHFSQLANNFLCLFSLFLCTADLKFLNDRLSFFFEESESLLLKYKGRKKTRENVETQQKLHAYLHACLLNIFSRFL